MHSHEEYLWLAGPTSSKETLPACAKSREWSKYETSQEHTTDIEQKSSKAWAVAFELTASHGSDSGVVKYIS